MLVAGGYTASFAALLKRGTLRSGERDLDGYRQPRQRTLNTRRRCCLTARCSSQADLPSTSPISRARNSTIRRAGPGRRPAASPRHALSTRRRCCPTARCSSQAVLTSADLASAELYDPASGTWTSTGSLATARVCHTATLLPNGKVLVAGGYNGCHLSRARNSTIRRAGHGRPPAASPPHAIVTRRHCCPTARCWSQAVLICGNLASAELYDPASGTWTATGSLANGTLWSHGDVATRRQGAGRRRYNGSCDVSRARNSMIRRAGLGRATGSLATGR